jgi:hypothetical protein
MITSTLKQILIDAGCTLVLYESDKIANLKTDKSDQFDIVGLIIQPNQVTLEVKANSIIGRFNPFYIEIFQHVELEDAADVNEIRLQECLDVCKQIIVRLIATGQFKKLQSVTLTKIQETKYDANVIGWALPLDLYWYKNENREPCIEPPYNAVTGM